MGDTTNKQIDENVNVEYKVQWKKMMGTRDMILEGGQEKPL